ncbi:MAG: prepilin-type N-terminal cleavage/methylation domain-containing protein [Burkholderiaceae bacterium]|jgi:general secretion pathway protein I|nr:prepilin-type N-terminal cleavage/methylation domain-containing protein [Burkholderiaceae bacterium]
MMNNPMPSPARRRLGGGGGFTLLEAIVAMAIAAIAVAALYRAVGQGAQNAVALDQRAQAALVARSALASALFAEDMPRDGRASQWLWHAEVVPEPVIFSGIGEQESTTMQAARVSISVRHTGADASALVWTAWKPLRAQP